MAGGARGPGGSEVPKVRGGIAGWGRKEAQQRRRQGGQKEEEWREGFCKVGRMAGRLLQGWENGRRTSTTAASKVPHLSGRTCGHPPAAGGQCTSVLPTCCLRRRREAVRRAQGSVSARMFGYGSEDADKETGDREIANRQAILQFLSQLLSSLWCC